MTFRTVCLINILLAFFSYSQFPEDIVLGPGLNTNYTRNCQQLRFNLRLHIPGDYVDIETDLLSLSIFTKKEMVERFGVSWISLLWIPPALASNGIKYFRIPEIIILGLNAILNANINIGNCWIRGSMGWKNDFFIFNNFLWVFDPNIGCKIAFPDNPLSEGAVRFGVSFPTFISNYKKVANEYSNFYPQLSIGIDILLMYAEIRLGGR
jgi:hypothetical protein